MERLKLKNDFSALVKRGGRSSHGFAIKGKWEATCKDKDGNIKWVEEWENLITNEGLDHILSIVLDGGTQITTWYVGLMNASPTVAAADTLASHAGWTENALYAGTRKAAVFAAPSGQALDNSASPASFTISTAAQSIGGAFLASATSGTTGVLLSGGAFLGGNKALGVDDVIEVTIVYSAADA